MKGRRKKKRKNELKDKLEPFEKNIHNYGVQNW